MAGSMQHWPTITKYASHFLQHQCKCKCKLIVHADGQIYREPAHSCQWDPPNNSVTDSFLYALYTTPDCCYFFCPIALPTDATSLPMSRACKPRYEEVTCLLNSFLCRDADFIKKVLQSIFRFEQAPAFVPKCRSTRCCKEG